MELITETLAAGQMKQFRKGGVYFEVLSAQYGIAAANFYTADGSQINSLKNVPASTYVGFPFGGFDLVNGAQAQTVLILIADAGESGGTRNIAGSVRVIEQNVDKTNAATQFIGVAQQNANATQFGIIALKSTSKQLAIKRLQIISAAGGFVLIGQGTGVPTANPANYGSMLNKKAGSPVSDVVRYGGTCAAQGPTVGELPGVTNTVYWPVSAGVAFEMPLTTPIVIPAGTVFFVVSAAVNANISIIPDFEEA